MHLFIIPDWFNHAYIAAVAAIALWRGGSRPRVVALTLLIVTSVQHVMMRTWPSPAWTPIHLLEASLDLFIFAACLACAMRGRGYWALWASSFMLLSLINQLLGFLGMGPSVWAIGSGNIIWAYALGAAIVWGAFAEPRPARKPAAA